MVRRHSKSTFAQDSRVLTTPPPCLRAPPPPPPKKKGTFVLARTNPLSLNFYTCKI